MTQQNQQNHLTPPQTEHSPSNMSQRGFSAPKTLENDIQADGVPDRDISGHPVEVHAARRVPGEKVESSPRPASHGASDEDEEESEESMSHKGASARPDSTPREDSRRV
jgi:hypothetical protein